MHPLLVLGHSIPVEHHQATPSTQLRARELLSTSPTSPLLITADRQTGGLGRTGRHWESPLGGLWLTLLWPLPPHHQAILHSLGLRVGLACLRTISHLLAQHAPPVRARLKWPNDILLETPNRAGKAAGVIVEVRNHPPHSYALVGVGINLNNTLDSLPVHLQPHSDTIRTHTSRDIPLLPARDRLVHELVDALTSERLTTAQLAEIRDALWGVGHPLTLTLPDGARIQATLLGINDDGRLQLNRDGQPWLAPLSAELAPPAP